MCNYCIPKIVYDCMGPIPKGFLFGTTGSVTIQPHGIGASIALPKGYERRKIGTVADCGNGLVSITAY